jgi:ATP-dependent RNA circularization protein (DNA/RNA ligase family)
MIDIDKIKYPHISHMYNVEPNIEAFLGRKLYIQTKLDGSNAGFYLNDAGEVMLRSRNNTIADAEMQKWAKQSGCLAGVKDLLESAADWHTEYVLFGELYGTGSSPTRITTYNEPFFVAFDLWSAKEGGFLPYVNAYQQCHHSCINFIELAAHGQFSNVNMLQDTLEELLDKAKERKLEGYVIKSWDYKQSELDAWNVHDLPMMFKHKLDTPRLEKIMKVEDFERITLPVLSDSDVYGAIDRVKRDNGEAVFKDIKLAMPIVAKYISDECKQHNCRAPKNLHQYYLTVLKEMN